MAAVDKWITDILTAFGEPTDGNVWFIQGQPVITHKCAERIGAKAGIEFSIPQVIRAERDEAVILVIGRRKMETDSGEVWMTEWSIGEALVNTNYRISGKQAAYPWAMAEKRAKDRVILKLIGLHGVDVLMGLYGVDANEDADQGPPKDTAGSPVRLVGEQPDSVHWAKNESLKLEEDMIDAVNRRPDSHSLDRLTSSSKFENDRLSLALDRRKIIDAAVKARRTHLEKLDEAIAGIKQPGA